MSDKIDFSKFDNKDGSLISLEELFPEYARGGENFPSGQAYQATEKELDFKEIETTLDDQLANSDFWNMEYSDPFANIHKRNLSEHAEEKNETDLDFLKDDPELSWLKNAPQHENLEPEKNQEYWTNRFNELNFPGMDLMAVSYFGSFTYDLLEQHLLLRRCVRDFVRLLSYNYVNDLRSAGVSEEGIFYMKKGKIPENYTVHLKYPLEYGGAIEFNNMVFIQEKPFHDMIHMYLDEQILSNNGVSYPPLLYVPVPVGKIYVPFGVFTGSGGKNKQDRSVYAGFSQAAFDKIALKAMPGR